MLSSLIPASRIATPLPGQRTILHGGDYNPDQWLPDYPDILDQDARLMREAGINSISIGIFSWAALEPKPDVFTFDWLDRVFDAQQKLGNAVILATPTGAMPAWLAEKYPEARRVDRRGLRAAWRDRHNHCWTSPAYHDRAAIINAQLAHCYKGHPALKMWHISNELSGECFCELCRAKFADWLKARYGTLDHLNSHYWAGFWSKLATRWEHVEPTDYAIDAMMIDWNRFNRDQLIAWYRFEASILRPITPEIPITTNFMGTSWNIDYATIAGEVDVVCDDQYPAYDADSPHLFRAAAHNSMKNSLYRCFKNCGELAGKGKTTFFLMECCPGAVQWKTPQKLKRPGVHRLEMLQAIAAGADGVSYFQFRAGRGGHEKLHGAVVEHAIGLSPDLARQSRTFQGVAELSRLYTHLAPLLGTGVAPEVAIVHDWESRLAQRFSAGTGVSNERYDDVVVDHFEPFFARGIPVDVVSTGHDLSPYKLVILPQLWVMTPLLALKLRKYVESGGTLLATFDTGHTDESNRMHIPGAGDKTGAIPGCGLTELFGLWVEEVDRLAADVPRALKTLDPALGTLAGREVAALTHLTTARPLAEFADDFYAGRPALAVNTVGRGHAMYLATRLDAPSQVSLCNHLIDRAKLTTILPHPLPPGVTAQLRGAGNDAFLFLLNFSTSPQTVNLGTLTLTDLETSAPVTGATHLPPLASKVYRAN